MEADLPSQQGSWGSALGPHLGEVSVLGRFWEGFFKKLLG